MKTIEYQAIFQEEADGSFSVWVPDLPGCASQGETLEEALANIREAMALYLEDSPAMAQVAEAPYRRQFVVPVQFAHA